MIVTITPNPSLDRSVLLDRLDRGEVHRAGGVRVEPGGKGVNVARALTATDHSAVWPCCRPEGRRAAASPSWSAPELVASPRHADRTTKNSVQLVPSRGGGHRSRHGVRRSWTRRPWHEPFGRGVDEIGVAIRQRRGDARKVSAPKKDDYFSPVQFIHSPWSRTNSARS
ncbi:hypothetical protein SAMN04487905_10433 [Actinopolyspora xinjiangensis]|uniref:PfkB family carbohydrate kinase n=1 Tax=Actinopolyspora xinjiangensis TaxID=405564 RepID=A0A1H0SKB6_9ACTN|nr:hypothetical protein SAMN04487905_10433 [Actinopolyspora xinjiangensis]